jgi:hypothetical protein
VNGGPITVVQSKNEIQRGDNVVAVVNSNDERLSGAAALVSGGVMFYDKEYLDIKYPTIPAHEYGHWMGHLDSWMRLSRDKREIMYNKKDALQNNYPVPNEFKRSRSNPGLTAPKSKDLRPSKSKKDE